MLSFSSRESPMDLLPLFMAAAGMSVCLFGHRISRLFCFGFGFACGLLSIYNLFENQVSLRYTATLPLTIALLASLVCGVFALLLHTATLAALQGAIFASIIIALDNQDLFAAEWARFILIALFVAVSCIGASHDKLLHNLCATSVCGAFIVCLSLDQYSGKQWSASLFSNGASPAMTQILGLGASVPHCSWTCGVLIVLHFVLSALGAYVQLVLLNLDKVRREVAQWDAQESSSYHTATVATPAGGVGAHLRTDVQFADNANYGSIQQPHAGNAHNHANAAQMHRNNNASSAAASASDKGLIPDTEHASASSSHDKDSSNKAAFNFYQNTHLPASLQQIYPQVRDCFIKHGQFFGFQHGNMQNQAEHCMMLLYNLYSHTQTSVDASGGMSAMTSGDQKQHQQDQDIDGDDGDDSDLASSASSPNAVNLDRAIHTLHIKVFSNYRQWCEYLQLSCQFASMSAATSSSGPAASPTVNTTSAIRAQNELSDIILWLLIWGEASSLRHMPECLAFLFHSASAELQHYSTNDVATSASPQHLAPHHKSNASQASSSQRRRAQGAFLQYVVKPLHTVLLQQKGDIHTELRNYDDCNEYFWAARCCNYYYASQHYRLKSNSGDLEKSDRHTSSIADALRVAPKTFLEKRHWLHPVRSFHRLLAFYAVSFHFLIALAYVREHQMDVLSAESNRILSSFVLSIAAWSLLKELLDLWATYAIVIHVRSSVTQRIGFIVRIALKSVIGMWLLCTYLWSYERTASYYTAYTALACLYMCPIAVGCLVQLFPAFSTKTRRLPMRHPLSQALHFWYPVQRLYTGRDVHERSDLAIYRYQCFWITLLVLKFYISLVFQISPLILPTEAIIHGKPAWNRYVPHYNALLTCLSLITLWLPFVLVYLFDTVIWYFLWQAVVGVLVGMKLRLGEIRSFPGLVACFARLPIEFETKCMSDSAAALDSQHRATHARRQSVVAVDEFRTRAWLHFAVIWNEIVRDIRAHDLLSDAEQHLLLFRFVPSSDKDFYLPLLLTAGVVDAVMERALEMSQEYASASYDTRQRLDCSSQFHTYLSEDPLRYEGMSELWECCKWLLCELLGEQHAATMSQCVAHCEMIVREHALLAALYFSKMASVKSAMLNLVRGLRIALASLAAHDASQARARQQAKSNRRLERQQQQQQKQLSPQKVSNSSNDADDAENSQAEDDDAAFDSDSSDASTATASTNKKKSSSTGSTPSFTSMMKSPSVGTLHLLDTIRSKPRYAVNINSASSSSAAISVNTNTSSHEESPESQLVHLNLIRDQWSALLAAMQGVVQSDYRLRSTSSSSNAAASHDYGLNDTSSVASSNSSSSDAMTGQTLITRLKQLSSDRQGFAWSDTYATQQLTQLLRHHKCAAVLTTMHASLSTAAIDAQPASQEATRRLLFFANSLFMSLPSAPTVARMRSFTTLTPFHSEDVAYSHADLSKETEDGVSVFFYLQTIYSNEWRNFVQRQQHSSSSSSSSSSSESRTSTSASEKSEAAQAWCTNRGQTLGRTVDGMMQYGRALRVLAKLELPDASPEAIDALVAHKFQYVVSCQVYGKQRREHDPKAKDIDTLLRRYPQLRVAYIDQRKGVTASNATNGTSTTVTSSTAKPSATVPDQFYSVLIKADPESGEIVEVYRVELPGQPIIGEGKPENQNHAIVFTRGEALQTIDMNQSNGLEEAFKMRNLLQEFDTPAHAESCVDSDKPVGIVGFREHIYTGSLSSIANFMALQEGTFVSQGQRVLENPLCVRFHYGHPDLFDKFWVMARGGCSKASRGINLSEDIFSGFNYVSRGASIKFREYISCGKGRDVGLQQLFKFEAKLAQGNAMQSLSRDVYRLAHTLDFFRLLSFYFGGVGFYISNCLTIWALHFFLLSRVLLAAFSLQAQDTFSGADTISYWFGQIGFVLTLPVFGTLGLERGFTVALFDVARMMITGGPLFFMFHMGTKAHYFEQTILAGGARYRPTGRGFVTRHEDFSEIFRFHASSHFYKACDMALLLSFYALVEPWGYSYMAVTWAGWLIVLAWLFGPFWFNPLAFDWDKTLQDARGFAQWLSRTEGDGDRAWKAWWRDENEYLMTLNLSQRFGLAFFAGRHALVGYALLHALQASRLQCVACALVACTAIALLAFVRTRFSHARQLCMRATKALVVCAALALCLFALMMYVVSSRQVLEFSVILMAQILMLASVCNISLICGARWHALIKWYKLCDTLIAGSLLGLLGLLSLTVVPSMIQTRLMFHNAFSRGVLIDKLLKRSSDNQDATNQPPESSMNARNYQRVATRVEEHGSALEGLRSPVNKQSTLQHTRQTSHEFDPTAVAFIENRSRKKKQLAKQSSSGVSSTNSTPGPAGAAQQVGGGRHRSTSDASDSDAMSVVSDSSTQRR